MLDGGEDGIRTHVELPPNGFQDRPAMTASVPLQDGIKLFHESHAKIIIPQNDNNYQILFILRSNDTHIAHVRTKNLRNYDAAVRLLVVLENSRYRPTHGKP